MIISAIDKRALKIEAAAYGKGWTYQAGNNWKLIKDLEEFDLMKEGYEYEVCNVIEAYADDKTSTIRVFDFTYQINKLDWDFKDMEVEEGKEFHRQTIFYVVSNQMDLPDLDIKPESLWHKVKQFFGWDDVDFDKNQQFSKMYSVTSDDKQKLKSIVSERFMDLLDDEKVWWIEGHDNEMIVFQKDKLVEPAQLDDFLNFGISLFKEMV